MSALFHFFFFSFIKPLSGLVFFSLSLTSFANSIRDGFDPHGSGSTEYSRVIKAIDDRSGESTAAREEMHEENVDVDRDGHCRRRLFFFSSFSSS